jgi:hypothetical protein
MNYFCKRESRRPHVINATPTTAATMIGAKAPDVSDAASTTPQMPVEIAVADAKSASERL